MKYKLFLKFFLSFLFSIVGFFLFSLFYSMMEIIGINIELWGDKAKTIFSLLFGLSIGGTFGVFIGEKLHIKKGTRVLIPLGISLVLSIFGNYLGVLILDQGGGHFFIILPVLAALMCVLGFKLGILLIS